MSERVATMSGWRGWLGRLWRALAKPGVSVDLRLAVAILDDDPALARDLLSAGASATSWGGGSEAASVSLTPLSWTPLGCAALHGRQACVELLLPYSDPSKAVRWGDNEQSALMAAASSGSAPCVELLLPVSDPRAQDAEGASALMIAITSDAAEAALLLAPWSDLEARDARGRTALALAAHFGQARCVRALLQLGADPLAKCAQGKTALMEAAGASCWDCVSALAPVSDLSAKCQQGLSAAQWARRGLHSPERERVGSLIEHLLALAERSDLERCVALAPKAGETAGIVKRGMSL